MKQFIFLYPIPEFINFEIENHRHDEVFKQRYKDNLNKCIDLRYRQKKFNINYAVFNNHQISDFIEIQPSDRIIEVGMDFKTHTTKLNGEYQYPSQDYILDQLGGINAIRIAGFHMWDCVERLAKRAYERGLTALVDEDLTEFFAGRLDEIDLDKFPTFNPRKLGKTEFESFMNVRRKKPWLWQEY